MKRKSRPSKTVDFAVSAAFFFNKNPWNVLAGHAVAVHQFDEFFCGHLSHIVWFVGERGDAAATEFTEYAVVEADNGHLTRNAHMMCQEEFDRYFGDLVVVANNGRTTMEERRDGVFPNFAFGVKYFFEFSVVPEHLAILHWESEVAQGVDVACIALMTLKVIVLEDTGDLGVSFGSQIFYQHTSAIVVIIQNRDGVFQLAVIAVEEHQRDPFLLDLTVQVEIWIWVGGFGTFHQNTVNFFMVQKTLEDAALHGDLIGGGIEHHFTVVGGEDRFGLTKHAWEDVVGDIGCDNSDRSAGILMGVLCIDNTGAAALPALDQTFVGKTL